MDILRNEDKTQQLVSGFLLLDEKEQAYLLGVLNTLLWAAKDKGNPAVLQNPQSTTLRVSSPSV